MQKLHTYVQSLIEYDTVHDSLAKSKALDRALQALPYVEEEVLQNSSLWYITDDLSLDTIHQLNLYDNMIVVDRCQTARDLLNKMRIQHGQMSQYVLNREVVEKLNQAMHSLSYSTLHLSLNFDDSEAGSFSNEQDFVKAIQKLYEKTNSEYKTLQSVSASINAWINDLIQNRKEVPNNIHIIVYNAFAPFSMNPLRDVVSYTISTPIKTLEDLKEEMQNVLKETNKTNKTNKAKRITIK